MIDPKKIKQTQEFKTERPLTNAKIDPTGSFICAGAEDLNVHCWRIADGQKHTFIGHESWVRSLTFSQDGKTLFSAGCDGRLGWWRLDELSEKPQRLIDAHDGWVQCARVAPDGKTLATCGNDYRIKLWNADTGELLRTMIGHQHRVYCLAFHPDGKHLVSDDLMSVVKVWDLETGQTVQTIENKIMYGYDNKFAAHMGGSRDLCYSPDGSEFVCAGVTNVTNAFAGVHELLFVMFDTKTGKQKRLLKVPASFKGVPWGVQYHSAGYVVGVGASQTNKGAAWFWKTNDKAEAPAHTYNFARCARSLDLTADHSAMVIAHNDGAARIYQIISG